MRKPWTVEEEATLAAHYKTLKAKALAELLPGRTQRAIRLKLTTLAAGVTDPDDPSKRNCKHWRSDEVEQLQQAATRAWRAGRKFPLRQVAAALQRSPGSVVHRLRRLRREQAGQPFPAIDYRLGGVDLEQDFARLNDPAEWDHAREEAEAQAIKQHLMTELTNYITRDNSFPRDQYHEALLRLNGLKSNPPSFWKYYEKAPFRKFLNLLGL